MEIEKLYEVFLQHPRISTDSRAVEKNSLFFALKGENHDANHFAKQALDNGACYAIVDNPGIVESDRYILVEDTLEALQQLALHHRKQFRLPVLAITGSNGKTTTKELLAAVLGAKYNCLYSIGNLNNHIGLPLTILGLNHTHQIACIEMGANHIGEIEKLCQIAQPTFGLITNIGSAHLEGFGSFEGVIKAKTELYNFINLQQGKIFINSDDSLLMNQTGDLPYVSYGIQSEADYYGKINSQPPFIELTCRENCSSYEIRSKLTGIYNAYNIMAAICVGRYFGVPVDGIRNAIYSYTPQNNRSQIIDTEKNHIILDAYNANPSSMAAALNNFRQYPGNSKLCILGDMLELGDYSVEEHAKIRDLATQAGFQMVLFVGQHFMKVRKEAPNLLFLPDTQTAKQWLTNNKTAGNTILIKGSRKIQLELLTDQL
jgi:UDP-N-acetylmuramoyl-tripeptide--D-alanyl-D-alanine ligase